MTGCHCLADVVDILGETGAGGCADGMDDDNDDDISGTSRQQKTS